MATDATIRSAGETKSVASTSDRFGRCLPDVSSRHRALFKRESASWLHGLGPRGGTIVGVLAEMLAASLNANCGGRDHAPLAVEKQIVGWMRDLMGFPSSANGVFVTGSSIANFLAILVARNAATHFEVRETGSILPASGRSTLPTGSIDALDKLWIWLA